MESNNRNLCPRLREDSRYSPAGLEVEGKIPAPGNIRTDCNIRADEFSNGRKETEGGPILQDERPSKGA